MNPNLNLLKTLDSVARKNIVSEISIGEIELNRKTIQMGKNPKAFEFRISFYDTPEKNRLSLQGSATKEHNLIRILYSKF